MKLLQPPVSQLAKTPLLTLKTNNTNGFTVSQPLTQKPCARTHAHEQTTKSAAKATKKQLYKTLSQERVQQLNGYIKHINFFNTTPPVDTGFNSFYSSIFGAVPLEYQHLFYELVCAITKLHKNYRDLLDNKLHSTFYDYQQAIKLMTWALEPLQKAYSKHYHTVLQTITQHYTQQPFRVKQLVKHTGFAPCTIIRILKQLLQENKLQKQTSIIWVGRSHQPCLFFTYNFS